MILVFYSVLQLSIVLSMRTQSLVQFMSLAYLVSHKEPNKPSGAVFSKASCCKFTQSHVFNLWLKSWLCTGHC